MKSKLLFTIAITLLSQMVYARTMKPLIYGLVDMGSTAFYHKQNIEPKTNLAKIVPYAPFFRGVVINVTWAQLQAQHRKQALAKNNPIDKALKAIRAYNKLHPQAPVYAKLRVWGGMTAPMWAKKIEGGPIKIGVVKKGMKNIKHETVGLFWTAQYISAWRQLQQLLAKRYDDEPLIREVSVTSCMSKTDEPFVSWLGKSTIQSLHRHGYTDAAQKACLAGAMQDYRAWHHTWIDYPFNLFHDTDGLHVKADQVFTIQLMHTCQASGRCIISNHALNEPLLKPTKFIYAEIKSLHTQQPKKTITDYQTVSPKHIDWCGAISNGVEYYAKSIELWPDSGGFTTLAKGEVAAFVDALQVRRRLGVSECSHGFA